MRMFAGQSHLEQLRHELELEELELAEQRRLELAIQQAYLDGEGSQNGGEKTMPSHTNTNSKPGDGFRSQLDSFNDVSNI